MNPAPERRFHWLGTWIAAPAALSAWMGLAACQNAVSRDGQVRAAAPSAETPAAAAPAAGPRNSDTVDVEMAGVHMTLTLADAEAIKTALLARLRKSDVPDRDYLIRATEHVAPSIDEGFVRIGIWLLHPDGDQLALTYRMPPGPVSAQTYRAEVAKDGKDWAVKELEPGQIRIRQ